MRRPYQLRFLCTGKSVAIAMGCFILTSCSGIDSSLLETEADTESDTSQQSEGNQQAGTTVGGSGSTQNPTSNSTSTSNTSSPSSSSGNTNTSNPASQPNVAAALPQDAADLASKTWSADGPFNDWTTMASDRYEGKETLASVDENTAGKFIDSAVLGVFRRSENSTDAYSYDGQDLLGALVPAFEHGLNFSPAEATPASGLYNCNGGNGSAQVQVAEESKSGRTQAVLLASLNNCDISYKSTTNGEVAMAFDIVDGVARTSSIAFDNVEVVLPGQKPIYLSGTHVRHLSCDEDYRTVTNILVNDEAAADQLLFENVQRSVSQAAALGCPGADELSWDSVDGVMRDGLLGSVYITTPTSLQFSSKPHLLNAKHTADYDAAKLVQDFGSVEVAGVGDAKVVYSQEMSPLVRYNNNDNEPVISVSLDTVGNNEDKKYFTTLGGFQDGGMSRLKDSDNDGLHDSWEAVFDLDAQNPNDAESDVDDDGFTALDEYNAVTNPKSDREKSDSYKRYISVELGADADDAGNRRIAVSVIGSREYKDDPYLNVDWYTLEISSGVAEWVLAELPNNCEVTDDVNVLLCSFTYTNPDAQLFESLPLYIDYIDGETVAVDAEYVYNPYYRDNEFESITKERTFTFIPDDTSDFAFSAGPIYSTSEEMYDTLTSVRVTQLAVTIPHNLLVVATHDDELVVSKATYVDTNDASGGEQNCRVQPGRIVCEIDSMQFEDSYDITVSHRLTEEVPVDLNWRLISPDTAARQNNDIALTAISYMHSSKRLEEIIAAATLGTTVVLPAGDYSGPLSIPDDWNVNILGAESPERTRLFSYEVIGDVMETGLVGPIAGQSTIGRMDFHTAGAPVVRIDGDDVTIHDSSMSPIADMPHQMNGLVIAGSNQSYRLLNNRISGWGEGFYGRCDSLVSYENVGFTTIDIFIERNLFIDNECNSIIRHGTTSGEVMETADMYVNNNTFVNNPIVFLLALSDGYEDAYFINNIIVGAYSPMSIVNGALRYNSKYEFVSAGNLVWDSNRDELFAFEDHIDGKVDIRQRDISENPLFANAANGDYSLSFISPAIDSGADQHGYYFKNSTTVDADVNLSDLESRFTPVDQIDIGAFEFTP